MKNDYKVNGLYLVKKSHAVYQIEVLAISKTSYRIRWENGNSSWVEKEDFHFEYSLLELRLTVWLIVGILIPVLILVIYREYSGFWWTLFIAVLGGGYETWHYFNTRNK